MEKHQKYIHNADIIPIWDDIRIAYMNELNKISNSPNLNIFHWGLASLKQKQEERKAIATQLLITGFKRLHFVPTKIFNNRGRQSSIEEEKTKRIFIYICGYLQLSLIKWNQRTLP